MSKAQRRKEQLDRHYNALAAVAAANGLNIEERKVRVSSKLLLLDRKMHKLAEDYCNGDIDTEQWEDASDSAIKEIEKIFGGKIAGVFINGDPRGYTLKIDDAVMREKYSSTGLQRDWGGYGIFAPEITGD